MNNIIAIAGIFAIIANITVVAMGDHEKFIKVNCILGWLCVAILIFSSLK